MRTAALILALFLAACTKPHLDSYCEKYQRVTFADPGLRQLVPDNKRAVLANENTYERDCVTAPPHDR